MRLLAISDLHLGHAANAAALEALAPHEDDWLLVAGDIGETFEQLRAAFDLLTAKFARVIWTPGNHELWRMPSASHEPSGEERYQALVALARSFDVLTPEDPYALWPGDGGPHLIAPVFTLYDYSFRPDEVPIEDALRWALEAGVLCADEVRLGCAPFASKAAWSDARVEASEQRLIEAASRSTPLVLVSHFPLRRELAHLPLLPRFSIWCGTRRTEEWPRRFGARVAVCGHLHMRGTRECDGVRFEEVSLGYPRQWQAAGGMSRYLRQILPTPPSPKA